MVTSARNFPANASMSPLRVKMRRTHIEQNESALPRHCGHDFLKQDGEGSRPEELRTSKRVRSTPLKQTSSRHPVSPASSHVWTARVEGGRGSVRSQCGCRCHTHLQCSA